MNIEVELEKAIAKHKDKQAGVGEIRIDYLAEDCLQEIRRLKEIIEFYRKRQEEPCDKCAPDYSQGFDIWFTRYHTSDRYDQKKIIAKFCPNCGRRLTCP